MGHGRPDFFGTPIHPKWGTSRRGVWADPITAGAEETMITIGGCGLVVAGFIYTNDNNYHLDNMMRIYVNGEMIVTRSWLTLLDWNVFPPVRYPLTLIHYDPDVPLLCAAYSVDLPFESEVKLNYWARSSVLDVVVSSELTYYRPE